MPWKGLGEFGYVNGFSITSSPKAISVLFREVRSYWCGNSQFISTQKWNLAALPSGHVCLFNVRIYLLVDLLILFLAPFIAISYLVIDSHRRSGVTHLVPQSRGIEISSWRMYLIIWFDHVMPRTMPKTFRSLYSYTSAGRNQKNTQRRKSHTVRDL